MSLGGAMDGNLFETNMSLRCEIRSLDSNTMGVLSSAQYLPAAGFLYAGEIRQGAVGK